MSNCRLVSWSHALFFSVAIITHHGYSQDALESVSSSNRSFQATQATYLEQSDRSSEVALSSLGRESLPISPKMIRYARIVLAKFDTNGDGALSFGEWQAMPGNPSIVDYNGDGRIVVDEILRRMALYGQMRRIILMPSSFLGRSTSLSAGESAPSHTPSTSSGSERPPSQSDSGDGTAASKARSRGKLFVSSLFRNGAGPAWFSTRDINGDGQLSLAEFSSESGQSAIIEFTKWDRNKDGVVTLDEYKGSSASTTNQSSSTAAPGNEIANPGK